MLLSLIASASCRSAVVPVTLTCTHRQFEAQSAQTKARLKALHDGTSIVVEWLADTYIKAPTRLFKKHVLRLTKDGMLLSCWKVVGVRSCQADLFLQKGKEIDRCGDDESCVLIRMEAV